MLRAADSVHTSESSRFLPLLSTLRAIPVGSSLLLYAQSLTHAESGSRLLAPKLNVRPYRRGSIAEVELKVSKEEQGSVVRVVDLLESDTAT